MGKVRQLPVFVDVSEKEFYSRVSKADLYEIARQLGALADGACDDLVRGYGLVKVEVRLKRAFRTGRLKAE